jgi:hypothetical protein
MGPNIKALDFRLHSLPSAVVSAALPRGHVALAFVYVGVGFADSATTAFAVGFLRIYGFYIAASVYFLRLGRHLVD